MISNQRHLFSLPENLVYLNHAYMSPNLKTVEEAGRQGVAIKNVPSDITIDDFFNQGNELRSLFGRLIDNDEPGRIAIIPSVSYAVANAAANAGLQKGDEVLIVSEQFPSNYYMWKRYADQVGAEVKIIGPDGAEEARGEAWNKKILDNISIKTKVLTMPIVHWSDGTLFHLKELREKTLSVNALMIIDGTQSIGAIPFSLKECPVDALIVAAYKWMMGPYSIGAAYYGPRFDGGQAIEESWINRQGSEDFANLSNYTTELRPMARRYEVGEASNFTLLPMMIAGIKQLLEWGITNVGEYAESITKEGVNKLRSHGCWVEHENFRSSHLFGIRMAPNMDMDLVKKHIKEANIKISYRGDAIRVSPHLYCKESDFDVLVDCILQA